MARRDLLEREADLAKLESSFAQVCSGNGRLVLVGGEAGIGKTSLVESFVAGHAQSALILRGYCDALLTPAPFGPFREVAQRLDAQLASSLEVQGHAPHLFGRFLDCLKSVPKPCVLMIEDIHWADQGTLDLIKYLSRRLAASRVMITATYRDDEVRRHHLLQNLLGDLSTTDSIERLTLARLSPAAVAMLAQEHGADANVLYGRTAGNPFFVTEALAHVDTEIPASVRDAVLARASSVTLQGRTLLDLAAVVGIRVEYALLEAVHDTGGTGLSDCLAAGLLEDTGSSVAFRHMLARDAVLEAIEPLRRRALYRRVLAGMVRAGFTQAGQMARLAHYAESASSREDVIRYGLAAAQHASSSSSHREAAAHYRSVLRFSEGRPDVDRAYWLMQLARECAVIDELESSIDAYRDAITLWSQAGDQRQHGSALAALAWPLVRNGENAAAEAAVNQAIVLLEPLGPSVELAAAYRTQAHLRMLDRDREHAVAIGTKAIAMATKLNDTATLAEAEMVVGAAKLVADDQKGLPHLDRCIKLAQAGGLDDVVALAYMNIGSSYGEQYRLAAAEAELLKGLTFTRTLDLDHTGHYISAWLALTYLYQGRLADAAAVAAEVLARPSISIIARIMALVALGRVGVRRGDLDARAALDEALKLAARTGTLQRLAPVHAARAEMEFTSGDKQATIREAGAMIDLAVARRHAWHTGELLYWLQCCGVNIAPPRFVAAPYGLQLKGHWAEAAAAWRKRGCPYEEARALSSGDQTAKFGALELFDRIGAVTAAAALRRELRAAGIRHIPRGPRASTRANKFGLTQRELTILDHLARGLSNTKIAETLFISPKTVDHHVSAILVKLSASSRHEAVDLASQADLIVKNGEGRTAK